VQITFRRELRTSKVPLYSMNPELAELFMNVLTRDLVVPIISASVSWLIFGIIGSGLPSLPKFHVVWNVGQPLVIKIIQGSVQFCTFGEIQCAACLLHGRAPNWPTVS
jgi:hypothetical protein